MGHREELQARAEAVRAQIHDLLKGVSPRKVEVTPAEILLHKGMKEALKQGASEVNVHLPLEWNVQHAVGTDVLRRVKGTVLRGNGRVIGIVPTVVGGELVLHWCDMTGLDFDDEEVAVTDCGKFKLKVAVTYTVQPDGSVGRMPRAAQGIQFVSPETMAAAMKADSVVSRGWHWDDPQIQTRLRVSVFGHTTVLTLITGYRNQLQSVGEVLSQSVVTGPHSLWHAEPLDYSSSSWRRSEVTRMRRVVRFPNGRIEGVSEETHSAISCHILMGNIDAIEAYVKPFQVAGALPCSTRFDALVKAEQERARAADAAQAEADEQARVQTRLNAQAHFEAGRQAQAQALSDAELQAVSELDPRRQARVLAHTGRERTRVLRQEQREQAEERKLKDAQGSFKANLGSRAAGLDLSLFGLD